MANSVAPSVVSQLNKVKPPKDEWPTFILDLEGPGDRWTIRYFADYETSLWDDKLGWTYSAISYAWGYWHDKRTGKWIDSAVDARYPAFDPKIPKTWNFPVVNKNLKGPFQFQDPVDPIFSIEEIQKTLKALGTRFVWWDWACNAQGPDDELKSKGLLDLQTLEVGKMRSVYSRSMNGCLWLHTTTWARDAKSIKGAVQLILEHANNIRGAGYDKLTADGVEAFLGLLAAAVNSQLSLTSVWSFQEGVLFGDDSRPQPGRTSKFPKGISTCVILDRNGENFIAEGLQGGDLVQDVVGVATIILNVISGALIAKANPPAQALNYSPFEKWCQSEETTARSMISRFIASGLISYHYNNPITLLESKFSRTLRSPWMSEADSTVKAIIGAMDVDINKQIFLDAVTAREKKRTDETAKMAQIPDTVKDPATKQREVTISTNKAEADFLRPAFFAALIKTYQWRMLLLARDNSVPQAAKAWWMTMLEVKRPPLASIGYYVDSGMAGLESMYRPRQPPPTTVPVDVYDLPMLEVSVKAETPLVVKTKPGYNYYDMTKPSSKGWLSCQFYEYLKSQPEDSPGTVGFTQVNSTDIAAREAKLGKNLLLLPLVDSPEKLNLAVGLAIAASLGKPAVTLGRTMNKPQPKWIRCVILADYDATARKAVFKGIGDFSGLSAADSVALDKDLEMW